MQNRAKEGSTKTNMHTFQLSAEDYAVQYDGAYANTADQVAMLTPGGGASFRNPFTSLPGPDVAYEDRATKIAAANPIQGITSYGDSIGATYNIKGYGYSSALAVVLTSGQ
jgi:hypothetical protein